MTEPVNFRALVEGARPVREFQRTLEAAFALIHGAMAAEAAVEAATRRHAELGQALEILEERRRTLGAETEEERVRLMAPVVAERQRLEAEVLKLRDTLEADQGAFDAERGRRASILQEIAERTQTAERAHRERVAALRTDQEAEAQRLRQALEDLKAQALLAQTELDAFRAEYRGVQDAAAKLVGRR